MNICDKHIKLMLWDTNCEAEYARMRPLTYPLTVSTISLSFINTPNLLAGNLSGITTIRLKRYAIEMKNKKYHIVGTVRKSNKMIEERGEIDASNTQIHNRSTRIPCLVQAF